MTSRSSYGIYSDWLTPFYAPAVLLFMRQNRFKWGVFTAWRPIADRSREASSSICLGPVQPKTLFGAGCFRNTLISCMPVFPEMPSAYIMRSECFSSIGILFQSQSNPDYESEVWVEHTFAGLRPGLCPPVRGQRYTWNSCWPPGKRIRLTEILPLPFCNLKGADPVLTSN